MYTYMYVKKPGLAALARRWTVLALKGYTSDL